MKKNIISLCVCGLVGTSSLSYAAANTNLVDMNPATARPKYEVSLGALYLKPSSSNLDYAVLGYPFPVLSPHWDVQSVAPSNSFGLDLSGRYYIPNTDYDLALSWDHLYTTDSDSTQVGSGFFVVFPFQAGPSADQSLNNPSQKARSNVSFTYNVVNLNVGKNVDFGSYKQMRFFVGLSGAQLQQNISTTFRDNADTYSINSKNVSKFNGIGPLIGIDSNCRFANGVGFFGTVAASALIGNLAASTKYTSSSPTLASSGISVNYQSISPKDSTQGVPGVEGKFGVDYTHRAGANSTFTASLGYQYVTYFNAITTYTPAVVFGNVNTGSIALSSLAKTWSNYTVQGPFLNVGFSFA